jgi:hypothetical protein
MSGTLSSHALGQYVDDELLRAPLLCDQLVEAVGEQVAKSLKGMTPVQRTNAHDLVEAVRARRAQVAEYFVRSLRDQVTNELTKKQQPKTPAPPARGAMSSRPLKPLALSLVDEDEVAVDVELAHTIEAIKSTAEYELRELQTYVGALVGDMDLAADHNPFRPEAYARALWAAAQALPLSRGYQVELMRHASTPLAQLLRLAYAASVSRLESMGIEPASYRTLILPSGSRRSRLHDTTFSPELRQVRETMPMPLSDIADGAPQVPTMPAAPASAAAAQTAPPAPAISRSDRQGQELLHRIFAAMAEDDRVPADVRVLLQRLRTPALKLALHDQRLLDSEQHPLWDFINQVAYEAEMSPDAADPERRRLLHVVQATIQQLSSEPEQTTSLHAWAVERLQTFLRQRLQRRCAAAASQIGALQKLEDRLTAGQVTPTTLHGTLDVPQLDTVPAELLPEPLPGAAGSPAASAEDEAWLDTQQPGTWLRLFLQGQWLHVQLLWPGERREIYLFGDGASDATWAVRRRALLTLKANKLMKGLTRRSLVGRAAQVVHAAALAERG